MGNARHISREAQAFLGLIAFALALPHADAARSACPQPTDLVITDFSRRFVQTRHLEGLDTPLVSEGTVSLKGDVVDWHVENPFDIRTTIGPKGITQAIGGGEPRALQEGSGGGIASFTTALAALLRVDLYALRRDFNVAVAPSRSGDGWLATLKPLDEKLAALLGTVDIRGCQSVDQVTLSRPSGDYDQIDILPPSSSKAGGDAVGDGRR